MVDDIQVQITPDEINVEIVENNLAVTIDSGATNDGKVKVDTADATRDYLLNKVSSSDSSIAIASVDIGGGVNNLDLTTSVTLEQARAVDNELAGDIDFNENNIIDLGYMDFFLTGTPTPQEGRLFYDDTTGTLNVGMKGGTVNLQIGQENLIRAKNDEAVQINNGQAVYIFGADGANPTIKLADNSSLSTAGVIGIATEDIPASQFGYATSFGIVREVDTSGCSAGDTLWLGSSGAWTNVRPTSPTTQVVIGVCLRPHATEGTIFVRTDIVPRLVGLSDVYMPSLADGDVPKYNSTTLRFESYNLGITKEPTGFTNSEDVVVTANGDRTVTLTGTFDAYYQGVLNSTIVTGWTSDAHGTDTTKAYFLTYDGSTISWIDSSTITDDQFFQDLLVTTAFYDVNNSVWVYGRECHGFMTWQDHRQSHRLQGTYRKSGGGLDNYVLNSTTASERRPSVEATEIWDEDLKTINPLLASGTYTQTKLTSTGIVNFVRGASDIVALSTNQPYWNEFTGGAWQQTLMTNNYYMSIFVGCIPMTADANSQALRYVFIQGQSESAFLSTQQALSPNSLNLGNLTDLAPEFVITNQIIIRYIGGNWQIVEVNSITGSRASQVSSPSGAYLTAVSSDATLTGIGTTTSPLSVLSDSINNIKELIDIATPVDNLNISVSGFYDNGDGGGGRFYWDASANKNTANGGTIIDPDTIGGFLGTIATRDAYLAAQGTGTGSGCWIRIYDEIDVLMFGVVGDGTTVEDDAVNAALDVAAGGFINFPSNRTYINRKSFLVSDDTIINVDGNVTKQATADGGIAVPIFANKTPPSGHTGSAVPAAQGYQPTVDISGNIAAIAAISNACLDISIDGASAVQITGIDFTGVATVANIATKLETALSALAVTVTEDSNIITTTSDLVQTGSSISITAGTGVGTNIIDTGLIVMDTAVEGILYTNYNISFKGSGVIDGTAINLAQKSPLGSTTTDPGGTYPAGDFGDWEVSPYYRARCINMIGVKGVKIEGITIKDAAEWAIGLRTCADIEVSNINVDTGNGNGMSGTLANAAANGQNQDGIHFENCINFTCVGNISKASDDCIAVGSVGLGAGAKTRDGTVLGNSCVNRLNYTSATGEYMSANGTRVTRAFLAGTSDQTIDNITIMGNTYHGGGAGVLIGDSDATLGSPVNSQTHRNIIVQGNTVSGLEENGLQTYAMYMYGAENSSMSNNTICDIVGREAIAFFNSKNCFFENNTVENVTDATGRDCTPIYANDAYGDIDNIIISNNRLVDSPDGGIHILDFVSGSYNITNITLNHNVVSNTNSSSATGSSQELDLAGIRMLNIGGKVKIIGNDLQDCNASGIFLRDVDDWELINNKVTDCALTTVVSAGIVTDTSSGSSLHGKIQGNTVTGSNGRGIEILDNLDLNIQGNDLYGNNLNNTGGEELYISIFRTAAAASAGGFIGNNNITLDGTQSIYGIYVAQAGSATSTIALEWGRNNITGGTSPYLRFDVTYAGVLEFRGASTPTAGNWRSGDIMHYTTGTAGGFIGETCTTGGAPGTWKTYGVVTT